MADWLTRAEARRKRDNRILFGLFAVAFTLALVRLALLVAALYLS